MLLGLFGGWAGTWIGGAGWAGSSAGEAALLALVFGFGGSVAGLETGDPLRLGRAGRLLPLALWVAALASLLASPVPRAGRVGVLLLPAYLLLPGIVAVCWRRRAAITAGVRSISIVAAGVAFWALTDLLLQGGERAAEPLGHHNLLAAWLVILLPLAVLPAREKGSWRMLGWGAGLLSLAALVASRSLAGIGALAAQVVALLVLGAVRRLRPGQETQVSRDLGGRPLLQSRRLRWALALVLLAALASQAGRIARVLGGSDNSVRIRTVYLQAGWEGFLARPALGWGPGATPWTSAAFLDPVPGVNPPSELVGELHSLPVQLAYELGAPGLLLVLALGAVFVRRRTAELVRQGKDAEPTSIPPGKDGGLAVAGLLGLLGAAVTALASAALTVTALPVAAAVAAGAALAGSGFQVPEPEAPPGRRPWRWLLPAYAALALAVLLPIRLASRHAERAMGADLPTARQALASAVRLDPSFPLYRARLAWVQEPTLLGRAGAAALARQAAEDGGAVGPLWLAAGVLGGRTGEPWAAAALERACDLDPLAALPPFYLAFLSSPEGEALRAGRAFLAEPRLAAAVAWERRPELRQAGLQAAAAWPGVPEGWRAALLEATASPVPMAGPTVPLGLQLDDASATAFSLHLFRRRPSPPRWPVTLRAHLAARFDLPPAAALPETSPEAFDAPGCGTP